MKTENGEMGIIHNQTEKLQWKGRSHRGLKIIILKAKTEGNWENAWVKPKTCRILMNKIVLGVAF